MIKQENVAIVTLKKGEGRTIKAGGAWVFNNEIETITGRFHNGDLVIVHDFDGYPMGKGYINQNSKIRVRLLTRHVNQEIDESFFQMRLQNAWNYRDMSVIQYLQQNIKYVRMCFLNLIKENDCVRISPYLFT